VTLIDEETLAAGDLSRFDTIVVGVRASESRPGFVTSNTRLLQYVRDGGTLIVQYQQTDYPVRKLTPFPAAGSTRVTDERAAVKVLQPQHPIFTFPNRITDEDWNGWVQERNLYAFATFDPQYTPLLETQDPGEPRQGPLRLHLVRLVSPAARGGARRLSTVCELAEPLEGGRSRKQVTSDQ
jgi:hypothetical protein